MPSTSPKPLHIIQYVLKNWHFSGSGGMLLISKLLKTCYAIIIGNYLISDAVCTHTLLCGFCIHFLNQLLVSSLHPSTPVLQARDSAMICVNLRIKNSLLLNITSSHIHSGKCVTYERFAFTDQCGQWELLSSLS